MVLFDKNWFSFFPMRLIFFLILFLSFLFAHGGEEGNPQDNSPADPQDDSSTNFQDDSSSNRRDNSSVNLRDNLPVREVVKDDEVRNVVEDRQYLFENFFFFEGGSSLEKRLVLDESLVYRINSPTFFPPTDSLLEEIEDTRFSSLSKDDQSKFLLQNVSLLIYPWNFFINQFFLLHDIRFSIYVENTYLYSDMASAFYKNFQSIDREPESIWYFRFRYVW